MEEINDQTKIILFRLFEDTNINTDTNNFKNDENGKMCEFDYFQLHREDWLTFA